MNTGKLANIYSTKKSKQRGAVLIVSLLVLLVLTLIGVSSLDNSIMEEKMASNSQISTTVFQSAESAIREKTTTYNQNDGTRSLAYVDADAGAESSCDTCGVTSATRMVYRGTAPLLGASSNSDMSNSGTMVAHGIEIIGTANYRGIQDSNAQGYVVYPMLGSK